MTQRNGTTLTEVLVAIFIMAIGMMSLLTLFPVGALSMAQAVRDERAAQAAANAAAIAEAKGLRHDQRVEGWFKRMEDPDPNSLFYAYSLARYMTPPYDGPSYPIFVDPLGDYSLAPPSDLGKPANPQLIGIPRTGVSYVKPVPLPQNFQQSLSRWFGLLDDMTYVDPAAYPQYGVPTVSPTDLVQREGRYSWTYLLRRPRFRDPSVVDMTVIVYNARSQVVPFGEQVFADAANPVIFDPTTNVVTVRYGAMGKPRPDIRKGQWIMDATVQKRAGVLGTVPDPRGYFYRVVSVTDNGTALALELQTPPKGDPTAPPNPLSIMVFLDGVVEVFDRGGGWQP